MASQNDKPRKSYTNNPPDTYEDNVAYFSPYYNEPVEIRKKYADLFGPNWASILAGIGDQ